MHAGGSGAIVGGALAWTTGRFGGAPEPRHAARAMATTAQREVMGRLYAIGYAPCVRFAGLLVVAAGCSFRPAATAEDAAPEDAAGDATIDATPVFCDGAPGWSDGLVPAATLYVAPVSDTDPTGTMTDPYPSLAAAAAVAQPGTRIVMLPGNYGIQTVTNLRGTATAPFWIEGAETGGRARLAGLRLSGFSYVVVSRMDIAASVGAGLNADDGGDRANPMAAHHLIVRDVDVLTAPNACLQFTGVYDLRVRRSSARACTKGAFLVGSHRAVLSRFTVESTSITGVQTAGGSSDIEIRQSRFTDAGTRALWLGGGSELAEFRPPLSSPTDNYEASNVRVFDNVIRGGVGSAVLCGLCTDSLVAANLIRSDTLSNVFYLLQEHGPISGHAFVSSGRMRIINNAIEVRGNPRGMRADAGTDGASCTFANNLWLEIDDPANSTPMLPSAETGGIYGTPSGYDADGAICTGAAVGAGTPLAEVVGTIDGTCRPTPPSIGPNEPLPGC